METRLAVLAAAELPGVNITALCEEMGISRPAFYRLRSRVAAEGPAGVPPRSRRPRRSPNQISAELEDEIVRLRKEHPTDHGAQSIAFALARGGWPVPATSTIHRALVRRGLVTPQPKCRPHSSLQRFEWSKPNECWQIDATLWGLTRGRPAWIMDTLDDHSRVFPSGVVGDGPTCALAWEAMCAGAEEWGWPQWLLSDNGTCFTGRFLPAPVEFEYCLAALGIKAIHSTPGHPQTCGKIERRHRNIKDWLRTQPQASTYRQLQRQIDTFRRRFNDERPHHGIGGQIPSERWHASPTAVPGPPYQVGASHPAVGISGHTVTSDGLVNTNRYVVHLGREWAGRHVTVVRYGLHCLVHDDQLTLIRKLKINPGHRYQPSGLPRGGAGAQRVRSQTM